MHAIVSGNTTETSYCFCFWPLLFVWHATVARCVFYSICFGLSFIIWFCLPCSPFVLALRIGLQKLYFLSFAACTVIVIVIERTLTHTHIHRKNKAHNTRRNKLKCLYTDKTAITITYNND